MNWSIILASACGIAVVQGFFLGTLLISKDKKQLGAYFFLGFTILAISLRIGKSLIYYFWYDMSLWGVALGGAGLWTIGPALWFYLQSLDNETGWGRKYIHFLPSIFLLFSGAFFSWSDMSFVYGLGTAQLFAYLLMSIYKYISTKHLKEKVTLAVLIGTGIIGSSFILQLISKSIEYYALGAIVASVVLYTINFVVSTDLQKKKPKQGNKLSTIKIEALEKVIACIQQLFQEQEVYKEPKLTLSKLAYKIGQPVYIVRQAIIQIEGKNFNDYVNNFRITEVKKLLREENTQYTIEGMAYDVGFSSVSSFYEAFKKSTQCTPVEYKKGIMAAK